MNREPMTKIIEDLTEIIRLQNEIIGDALMLLLQLTQTEDEAMVDLFEKVEFVREMNHGIIEADPLEDEGLPFNLPVWPEEKRKQ